MHTAHCITVVQVLRHARTKGDFTYLNYHSDSTLAAKQIRPASDIHMQFSNKALTHTRSLEYICSSTRHHGDPCHAQPDTLLHMRLTPRRSKRLTQGVGDTHAVHITTACKLGGPQDPGRHSTNALSRCHTCQHVSLPLRDYTARC